MALALKVGDVVRMKKAHPCGNHLWLVTRLGADIGITCQQCRRRVMLARSLMERRVKEVIPQSREPQDSGDTVISGC
jgi:hypothetical protein